MAQLDLPRLRRQAVVNTFPPPVPLGRALMASGFVQADPIRAPARAQDLILRHRVAGYRAGDLERRFARLGLEEDFLYAYGFMPRETQRLLHPRPAPDMGNHWGVPEKLAASILDFVRERGLTHPAELAERFGKDRSVNGWGGFSKATTRALQSLHYQGLLRVAGRREGIRMYAPALPELEPLAPEERARRIVRLVVTLLAPVADAGLGATFGLLSRGAPGLGRWRDTLASLCRTGELESGEVDRTRYYWPADLAARRGMPDAIRLLAPFDPLVWERRRFAHLWGWEYRFEAYTRPEFRRFGYYAMPLLRGYDVIGWANVSFRNGELDAELGFVGPRPTDPAFRRGLDAELAAMEGFLRGGT